MDDRRRLADLEVDVATLRADLEHHGRLCDNRWQVAWKLAALVGATMALGVSIAVTLWR